MRLVDKLEGSHLMKNAIGFHTSFILLGMPIDLICYPLDSLTVTMRRRFESGDNYFTALSKEWNAGIRDFFSRLADLE